MTTLPKKVPARYVGLYEAKLFEHGAPYLDGTGKPLTSLILHPGDTVMVNPDEVYGYTLLKDPRQERDAIHLGYGRVIRESDQGKSDEELAALGYEFHQKSALWEPLVPLVSFQGTPAPSPDLVSGDKPRKAKEGGTNS